MKIINYIINLYSKFRTKKDPFNLKLYHEFNYAVGKIKDKLASLNNKSNVHVRISSNESSTINKNSILNKKEFWFAPSVIDLVDELKVEVVKTDKYGTSIDIVIQPKQSLVHITNTITILKTGESI